MIDKGFLEVPTALFGKNLYLAPNFEGIFGSSRNEISTVSWNLDFNVILNPVNCNVN